MYGGQLVMLNFCTKLINLTISEIFCASFVDSSLILAFTHNTIVTLQFIPIFKLKIIQTISMKLQLIMLY